jgi:hypothetical protein
MQREVMETLYRNKSRQFAHLDIMKLRSWGVNIDMPSPKKKRVVRRASSISRTFDRDFNSSGEFGGGLSPIKRMPSIS